MSAPSAKVVADSVSPGGQRITSLEVVMHRFVLAEFNTHRKFSRNSASSRAIPYARQRERVVTDVALPAVWATEQKGMQGGPPLSEADAALAETIWRQARTDAVGAAGALVALGVHKSVANRLLEPFMWHTVLVTATDFSGFFAQRRSPLAQPEIRLVADAMWGAMQQSEPRRLEYGEYHLPYVDDDEFEQMARLGIDQRMVSAARCARVSYLTQAGKRDFREDLNLFSRLESASPPHASPMEHVARPGARDGGHPTAWSGNFSGWVQYRHELGFGG